VEPADIEGVPRTSAEVRRELGIPADAKVIGVSAALVAGKGHAFLLDALSTVLQAVPDAVIVLAGDGPAKSALTSQAQRLGVADKVKFLGHRSDIRRIVQAYDVIALSSLSESMPFSLLEGMACGKPVVASAIGGIPELVENGISGYLVPPGDSDAIAQALICVLEDPSRTARMGRAAFERVRSQFSIDTMVRETLNLMLGVSAPGAACPGRNWRG